MTLDTTSNFVILTPLVGATRVTGPSLMFVCEEIGHSWTREKDRERERL